MQLSHQPLFVFHLFYMIHASQQQLWLWQKPQCYCWSSIEQILFCDLETEYDKDLQRHLSLEKGMEVELTLSHSEMDPALLKKKSGMFKSFSFRKDK